jgi:hypothetical protein
LMLLNQLSIYDNVIKIIQDQTYAYHDP